MKKEIKKEGKEVNVKEVKKYSYADILRLYSIVKAVLLCCDKKELSSQLKSKVMSVRVSLGRIRKRFDEEIKEANEGLKPEGYDERMKPAQEFEEKIREKYPESNGLTEEMLSEGLTEDEQKLKEKRDAFMPEFKKYNEECDTHYSDKLAEKVEFDLRKFTQKEFDDILNVNSAEKYSFDVEYEYKGKRRMVPVNLPSADFMEVFYEEFVEE